MDKLVDSILNPRPLSNAAVRHGQKYESVAVNLYEKSMGVKIRSCGLFVCKEHPFLAASPDGLGEGFIVEVKCPYTNRAHGITSLTTPFLKETQNSANSDGKSLSLKKGHPYYYQVQGQLLCTNMKVCRFIVFTLAKENNLVVIDVPRDDDDIRFMLEKLTSFYEDHFKSKLLRKLLYRDYDQYW